MPSRKQSDPLPRLVSNESIRTHVLQLRSSTTQTATAGRKFAMSRKVCARVSRCANTLAWRLVYEAVRTASLAHAPGEAGPKSVRKGRGRYWVKVEHVKRALREAPALRATRDFVDQCGILAASTPRPGVSVSADAKANTDADAGRDTHARVCPSASWPAERQGDGDGAGAVAYVDADVVTATVQRHFMQRNATCNRHLLR